MTDESLEAGVRRADPDRWLASRFMADDAARADVIALLAYDHELARAGQVASNALVAEIRLTWWREVLDEIFQGRRVRRHPVAHALAAAVARHGLDRAPLEAMIDARIDFLDRPDLDIAAATAWADAAPGSAAVLTARILDPTTDAEAARAAGRAWGLKALGHPVSDAIREAAQAARALSPAAFPAAAHATLTRAAKPGPLEARLRLMWAVMRGRL